MYLKKELIGVIVAAMKELIGVIVAAIERLLIVLNTDRKIFTLILLILVLIVCYLGYQITHNEDIIGEFTAPRIERISGWCYQQVTPSLMGDRRLIGIQFPVPKNLVKLGVKENITAFVLDPDRKTLTEFDRICSELVNEILDPQTKINLIRSNPEWKKKLQDFYKNLDMPVVKQPLTNTKAPK